MKQILKKNYQNHTNASFLNPLVTTCGGTCGEPAGNLRGPAGNLRGTCGEPAGNLRGPAGRPFPMYMALEI
eukprot:7568448-Pyramimonas_sp.AAC.1